MLILTLNKGVGDI
ncbi:Protein of unknown function [Bacillus wiedmannii]|nr:Protein of unknown function [Bacillus wiedmannii]